MTLKRWLASTSNRTFIVWPVILFACEAALRQGVPHIHGWALPVRVAARFGAPYRDYCARVKRWIPGVM